jgi:hypothetical protein
MDKIFPLSLIRNSGVETVARSSEELLAELQDRAQKLGTWIAELAAAAELPAFRDFERELRGQVFALARVAVVLFLTLCEQRLSATLTGPVQRGERRFRRAPSQARNLTTLFGVVRYVRTYLREVGGGGGFHPLDAELGLSADRFSLNVLSLAVRLATKLSFAEARATLCWFMPNAPATEVIEKTVLGLGRHTAAWFESKPAPEEEGEVLIVMIDGKGAPTATEEELRRRRRKHRRRPKEVSPRHRGRARRKMWTKKPRRNKGDKSKNAKMATLVLMYTLRRKGKKLLGPLNRWVYASFAPKRHAFAIARREANKRGFAPGSGKLIQLLTDGDNDLACYKAEFFPEALHTIDALHVVEKLWTAGECLYQEGTPELKAWIEQQKECLYGGKVAAMLRELELRLCAIPKTGPGNKGRRERLGSVLRYLDKRKDRINYADLLQRDLEISSGPVEGAVKNIIGKRCDHGGMRWIKERAEALLQLRCIEANGDWERFLSFVHQRHRAQSASQGLRPRLQSSTPAPLPQLSVAA